MRTRFQVLAVLTTAILVGAIAPRATLAQPALPEGLHDRLADAAQRGQAALDTAKKAEGDGARADEATVSWAGSRTVTVEANGDLDQRDAVFHKPTCTSARAIVDGRDYPGTVKNGRLPLWVCPAKFKGIPVNSTIRIIIDGEYNGHAVHGEETFTVGKAPRLGNTVHVGTVLLRAVGAEPQPKPACPKKAIGDANCDGAVNAMDHSIWLLEYSGRRQTKDADFNGDGRVDRQDGDIVKAHLGD